MNENWFDKGRDIIMSRLAKRLDVSFHDAEEIFSVFQEMGFIDYDVEKEMYYEASEE